MKSGKMTSSVLSFLICASILTACGAESAGTPAESAKQPSADNAPETEAVTEPSLFSPDIPDTDLGGKEYHFFVMGPARNAANYSVEIYAEAENGDAITDAVFRRNSALQEKYNFVIAETPSTDNNMAADVKKLVMAGDDVYQVTMLNLTDASNLSSQHLLYALNETKYIDFSKPWWDSVMANELSVGKKVFYGLGDINIMDNNATWAVFFNKKLISDYDMPSPYADVQANNWTLDRYYEYITGIARDLDGDGVMDAENDLWGTVGEGYNAYMHYIAAGERLSGKNADDLPVLRAPTSRTTTALEKIMNIMRDSERVINAEKYSSKYASVFNDLIRRDFKTDHALFYVAGLLTFTLLRDMESEYGMVPMPKLDSAQEKYYTTLNYNNMSTVTMPAANQNPDETSLVIEALACASADTLTPAYYEKALERKYMRDEESRAMLDIILDSRVYDLCSLYDWGGVYSIIGSMVNSSSTDFMSSYAKKESAAVKAIEKFCDELAAAE